MTRLIPMVCPYCGWKCKLSRAHEDHCPSHGDGHAVPTEIVPGLWVGGVAARADERFVAVASILTHGEHHWAAGAKIAPPPGKWLFVEHEDRKPGLVAKATVRQRSYLPSLVEKDRSEAKFPLKSLGGSLSLRFNRRT